MAETPIEPVICESLHWPNGRTHSNYCAEITDWIGHRLTWCLSRAFEEAVRLQHKLRLGWYGQSPYLSIEICKRIFYLIRFVLLALIGFPLALICIPLRYLASYKRGDLTFVNLSPLLPTSREISLLRIRIVTFNTELGPECMSCWNHTRPSRIRVQELCSALIQKNCDLICLQETFHSECEWWLRQQLTRKGYIAFVHTIGFDSFKVSSGLFIASKYPLENPKFWTNPHKAGSDTVSRKGIVAVTVVIGSERFALFNLHLNASGPGGGHHYRRPQIEALKDHILTYTSEFKLGDRVMVVGDFNIGPAEEDGSRCQEWWDHETFFEQTFENFIPSPEKPGIEEAPKEMEIPSPKEILRIEKKFIAGTAFGGGWDIHTLWDKTKLEDWTVKQNRIDHILVHRNWVKIKKPEMLIIDRMEGASDHCGVIGEFHLQIEQ